MNEQAPARPYPRFWQAVRLVLLLILIQTALLILFRITVGRHRPPAADLAMDLFAYGIVLRLGVRRTGEPERAVFPLRAFRPWIVVASLLTIIGVGLIGAEGVYLLEKAVPRPESIRAIEFRAPKDVADAIGASLVGPILEELLFRGLILGGFLRIYSRPRAVFLSAMLFGLLHLSPWQGLSAFGAGLLLGWWRAETSSLWPCLAAHILWNAGVTAVRIWGPRPTGPLPVMSFSDQLFLVALAGAFLGAGVFLFRRISARRTAVPAVEAAPI